MVRGQAVIFAAAVVLLAGCVSNPPTVEEGPPLPPIDWDAVEAAIGEPIISDHDHLDAALHQASHNLNLVARHDGHEGEAAPEGEFFTESAVQDGYAYLCRLGPEGGLVIFDVNDPTSPKPVGYLHLDAGFEPDIEVSSDGKWAFWETQRAPTSMQTPVLDQPGANLPRGVHILDISDKTNPKWAGYSPTMPDGPHSITYANIAGRHILLQSVYAQAYAYFGVEVPRQQRLLITELDTSGPAPTLRTLAEYVEPGATGKGGLFPHDVSVQKHPLTNQTLAYIAYWNIGVVILNVSDPEHPTKVAATTDFGPAEYRSVHMARGFPELIGGRHITVVEPEIGGAPDSGYITFLDTTDPTHPTYVSSWKLPGDVSAVGGLQGPHYFDAQRGRVALAHYHAGFWVIDVHDAANLAQPRSAGYALVNATGDDVPLALFGRDPNAFDAWWVGDYVIGSDVQAGLTVFRYTGPAPDPA